MMKQIGFILLMITLLGMAALAVADIDKGAEEMTLTGGEKGTVWFPHRQHQENLKDCKKCHDIFPKEAGIIQKMKDEGALKKKQVMKKKCISCHRKTKKAGDPAGPTSCKKCHHKEK
jgi:hypothetical protein